MRSPSWRVEDDTAVSESKGLEGGPFEKQSSETTEVRLRQARRDVTEIEGVRAGKEERERERVE